MRPPTTSKEKAMRGVSLLLPLGLSLACAAGIAVAQPAGPDMTGTWTGTNKSIVSGLPAHFPVTAPSTIVDGNRLVVQGQPSPDGKSVHLWACDHEGWLTMDATAALR